MDVLQIQPAGSKAGFVHLMVVHDPEQLIQADSVVRSSQAERLVSSGVTRIHAAISGIDRVGQVVHRSVQEAEVRTARMMAAEGVRVGRVIQGN